MMRMMLCVALVGVVVGCADDGGPASGPPSITNLDYDPKTIEAGTAAQVNVQLDFTDGDGDVRTLKVELRQTGQMLTSLETPVAGVGGAVAGKVMVPLSINTPTTDPVEFDVWLVDDAGNESNKLTGTVQVVATGS